MLRLQNKSPLEESSLPDLPEMCLEI